MYLLIFCIDTRLCSTSLCFIFTKKHLTLLYHGTCAKSNKIQTHTLLTCENFSLLTSIMSWQVISPNLKLPSPLLCSHSSIYTSHQRITDKIHNIHGENMSAILSLGPSLHLCLIFFLEYFRREAGLLQSTMYHLDLQDCFWAPHRHFWEKISVGNSSWVLC